MNGLSDSLTIGLVLALIFGALFFYLYSRLGQAEKRVSLTENILLDLKMATENTMMAMASASGHSHSDDEENHEQVERVVPMGEAKPVEKEEVEQINDEEFYKHILEQAQAQTSASSATLEEATVPSTRLDANYEAMTLKELKAEAKRKGISVPNAAHKKDLIDALKRQGQTVSLLEGSDGVLEEGFPVEN